MSTKTTNYNLTKLELTDAPPDIRKINDNWDMIDTMLKNHADTLTTKRDIAMGTYVGDGQVDRSISVGFSPKAVLVMHCDGKTNDGNNIYGGLAVNPKMVGNYKGKASGTEETVLSGTPAVRISGTEFLVSYVTYESYGDNWSNICTNSLRHTYMWIAFGY